MEKIIKRKVFMSVMKEKKYIEKMNADGYELMKVGPFTYEFEKSGKKVNYEYVWLKKGRRSYVEFDYKSRDSLAKAVYANADCALFKKADADGGFTLFGSADEKKTNVEQKRTTLRTNSVIFIALACIFLSLARGALPVYMCVALMLLISIRYYINSKELK